MNLQFLVTGQEGALWTGYYTDFYGVKLAISNFLGIWFEIWWRNSSFKVFQVAREALNLQNHPLPGTSISLLITTSKRLPMTWPGSPQMVILTDESPQPPDPDPPSLDERIAMTGNKKDKHIWLKGQAHPTRRHIARELWRGPDWDSELSNAIQKVYSHELGRWNCKGPLQMMWFVPVLDERTQGQGMGTENLGLARSGWDKPQWWVLARQ
jgi:hypothetical protein